MNAASWQIRCSWSDKSTQQRQESLLTPPIAFGRDKVTMLKELEGRFANQIIINDPEVHRYHILLDIVQGELAVTYQNVNGLWLNGARQTKPVLKTGDILRIGSTEILVSFTPPVIPPLPPAKTASLTLEWEELGQVRKEIISNQQPSKNPGTVRLGRDSNESDIVVNCSENTISALHIEIFFNPDWQRFYLRNLKPSNPPFIDGGRLIEGEVALSQGNIIQLGKKVIKVININIDEVKQAPRRGVTLFCYKCRTYWPIEKVPTRICILDGTFLNETVVFNGSNS